MMPFLGDMHRTVQRVNGNLRYWTRHHFQQPNMNAQISMGYIDKNQCLDV